MERTPFSDQIRGIAQDSEKMKSWQKEDWRQRRLIDTSQRSLRVARTANRHGPNQPAYKNLGPEQGN